jgi:hypothetical protein
MAIGNFTRAGIEARASEQINAALQAMYNLEQLHGRVSAEFAAGTLDETDFYATDADDKANILGALDQAHAIYQWLVGKGLVSAPSGDPLSYAEFLIGLG